MYLKHTLSVSYWDWIEKKITARYARYVFFFRFRNACNVYTAQKREAKAKVTKLCNVIISTVTVPE